MVQALSVYDPSISVQVIDTTIEPRYVGDGCSSTLDQYSAFGIGMDYEEDFDQFPPTVFDCIPMEDAYRHPPFENEYDVEQLNDGRLRDLHLWSGLDVESIETTSPLPNYHKESHSDSMGPLPILDDTMLAPTSRIHKCIKCNQCFANEYKLEDHARLEGHQTYICKEDGCPKRYCRRDVLRRHMATHTRPEISCEHCSKSNRKRIFKRKDNLNQHIRIRHPEVCKRDKDPESSWVYQKHLLAAPETSDSLSCAGSVKKSEYGHLSPPRTPPSQSYSGTSTTSNFHDPVTEKIAAALGTILGDKDHIVVQIIQRRLDPVKQSTTEQLALTLAQLALVEPKGLPDAARVQLQQSSARCEL